MKKFLKIVVVDFLIIAVAIIVGIAYCTNKPSYTAEDFGIEVIKSKTDKDGDGIDDYTDILLGARAEAERKPEYKSEYYAGGYPPQREVRKKPVQKHIYINGVKRFFPVSNRYRHDKDT